MRIAAGVIGMLFMLTGAVSMVVGLALIRPGGTMHADGWQCTADQTTQTCRWALDSPQDAVIEGVRVQSAQIYGATLFLSGAVLVGGVVASSGRQAVRQQPTRPVPPPPMHPGGPPRPPGR